MYVLTSNPDRIEHARYLQPTLELAYINRSASDNPCPINCLPLSLLSSHVVHVRPNELVDVLSQRSGEVQLRLPHQSPHVQHEGASTVTPRRDLVVRVFLQHSLCLWINAKDALLRYIAFHSGSGGRVVVAMEGHRGVNTIGIRVGARRETMRWEQSKRTPMRSLNALHCSARAR